MVKRLRRRKSFSVTYGLRLLSFFLSFCLSHEFLSQLPISMLLDSQCIAMSENIHYFHNTYTTPSTLPPLYNCQRKAGTRHGQSITSVNRDVGLFVQYIIVLNIQLLFPPASLQFGSCHHFAIF